MNRDLKGNPKFHRNTIKLKNKTIFFLSFFHFMNKICVFKYINTKFENVTKFDKISFLLNSYIKHVFPMFHSWIYYSIVFLFS